MCPVVLPIVAARPLAVPALEVAVVMRRVRNTGPASRWQASRWELAQVLLQQQALGPAPRLLYQSISEERWLYPGYPVELFRDEVEGYYLNASTAAPCWFVLWRMADAAGADQEPRPQPERVSLSYHEAGRWLDAQETVEQVAAPVAVVGWLRDFVAAHPVLEPKQRQRAQSFRPLADRFGNPAQVSSAGPSGAEHG